MHFFISSMCIYALCIQHSLAELGDLSWVTQNVYYMNGYYIYTIHNKICHLILLMQNINNQISFCGRRAACPGLSRRPRSAPPPSWRPSCWWGRAPPPRRTCPAAPPAPRSWSPGAAAAAAAAHLLAARDVAPGPGLLQAAAVQVAEGGRQRLYARPLLVLLTHTASIYVKILFI